MAEAAPATGRAETPVLEVIDLKKHFPLKEKVI